MYSFYTTNNFRRKKRKIINDSRKKKAFRNCLATLQKNPFHSSLKTHKALIKYSGKIYSSWVLGDIRIAWNFNNDEIDVLDLFDIGTHKYYK